MMYKLIISLFLFIAASAEALAGNELILYNGNIVDPGTGEVRYNQTIEVRDGMIYRIRPAGRKIRKGETDATGRFLIPGMIDSHTHYGNFCEDSLKAAELSAEYLKQGVTTVRDVGGNYLWIRNYNRLRSEGAFAGPEIFYSSIWAAGDFTMPAYHTRGADSDNTPWSRMMSVVDSTDTAIEKAVIEAKEIGCTGFKLYINYTKEDLARMIPIMKKHGMKVWAHATQVSGARALEMAEAGADVLSHAYMLPDDITSRDSLTSKEKEYVRQVCRKMKENGTVLDITAHISMYEGKMQYCRDVIRIAYEEGVDFVTGTDFFGNAMYEEICHLKSCGISSRDILHAATVTGAEILGMKGKKGTVSKGAAADLIVLGGNPLQDIEVLADIEKTILSGRTAYCR